MCSMCVWKSLQYLQLATHTQYGTCKQAARVPCFLGYRGLCVCWSCGKNIRGGFTGLCVVATGNSMLCHVVCSQAQTCTTRETLHVSARGVCWGGGPRGGDVAGSVA